MAIQENIDNGWNYVEKTIQLIEASQDAFDELVIALGKKLKATTDDEKMRAAIQAKRLALVDAKEILKIMQELEKMIGIDNGKLDLKEKSVYTGGGPERRFKTQKKKKR